MPARTNPGRTSSRQPTEHAPAARRLGLDLLIYARSSSDEQTESCKQQVRDIEDALRKDGVLGLDARLPTRHAPERGVFVDDGVSGWKVRIGDRPGSTDLLEHCRKHPRSKDHPGRIYIWALSRLGRFPDGPEEAIHTLYEFRRLGWWVRSLTQPGLDSEDQDRLLRVIRAALESEKDTASSEEKSRGVARGKRDIIKAGRWQGGTAPFGYDRWAARLDEEGVVVWIECLPDRKRNGNTDSFTLLRPSAEAEWVRRIFSWYADGDEGDLVTMNEISRRLDRANVPQSRNGTGWGPTIIAKILRNEAYVAVHRTADGEPHRMGWEPLVEAGVWSRAQARLARKPPRGRSANSSYPLTGLVTCKMCQASLWGEKAKSGRGHRLYYRATPDHLGARRCPSCRHRIPVEDLEGPVLEAIKGLADHPVVLRAVAEEQEALKGGEAATAHRTAEIDRTLEETRLQADRLVAVLAMGGLAAESGRRKLEELNRSAERLRNERERLVTARRGAGAASKAAEVARGFKRVYERATAAERKELVRAFVSRIEVDGAARLVQVTFLKPG